MLAVKFDKFFKADYEENDQDGGYTLYKVFNDNNDLLYIGISGRNIYNRWFSQMNPHIITNIYGEYIGNSSIGNEIVKNLPLAFNWEIHLYTLKECYDFWVNYSLEKYGRKIDYGMYFCEYYKQVEAIMISELRPKLNVIYNNR